MLELFHDELHVSCYFGALVWLNWGDDGGVWLGLGFWIP